MGKPLNIGIIGAGKISAQYLDTFARVDELNLVAVADLNPARAAEVAGQYEGVRALTVDELITDDEVDTVLNLTIPAAHAEIALRAIAAGKNVYGEKPLAATTAEGVQMVEAADAAGVLLGCAPDTVLGVGIQTARKAIDDGLIGTPVAATATMVTPGHERWHPDPDFYYVPGGGPLLDMGPYYVTALVTLLGPVRSVIGAASHTRDERVIGSGPREGQTIPVTIDTHVTGVLVHDSGALSTLVMSFDAAATKSANIEIHGQSASLVVPDPNHFDGDVLRRGIGDEEWETLAPSAGYTRAARGYGMLDFTADGDQPPRADGALALHVLDIMQSLLLSADEGRSVTVASTAARPEVVPYSEV